MAVQELWRSSGCKSVKGPITTEATQLIRSLRMPDEQGTVPSKRPDFAPKGRRAVATGEAKSGVPTGRSGTRGRLAARIDPCGARCTDPTGCAAPREYTRLRFTRGYNPTAPSERRPTRRLFHQNAKPPPQPSPGVPEARKTNAWSGWTPPRMRQFFHISTRSGWGRFRVDFDNRLPVPFRWSNFLNQFAATGGGLRSFSVGSIAG